MKNQDGAMILADNKCSLQTTYHIPINGTGKNQNDWLIVADAGRDVWITLKNCLTGDGKKEYYHLEIDKDSELWKHLINVINKCEQGE